MCMEWEMESLMYSDRMFHRVLHPPVSLINLSHGKKTKITNFGIDFGFLKDFDVTFDVFKRNTEGILITAPLPGVLGGLSAPYQNLANVKNKGWELSLNYHKNINPKVSVGANFNISHVSNIVTKYRGGEPIISGNTIIGDGYEYGAYYGFYL